MKTESEEHKRQVRTKIMKAVKAKGSKIEMLLMQALWKRGLRYRKHLKGILGTPDIAFVGKKVAVFCDSEFWHGKDWELRKADFKSNQEFWYKKIQRNIEKDIEVNTSLSAQGWSVVRFWGKNIMRDVENCCDVIERELQHRMTKKDP